MISSRIYTIIIRLKVRIFQKDFWYPRILPKNKRMKSVLLLRRICLLIFWENSRTPTSKLTEKSSLIQIIFSCCFFIQFLDIFIELCSLKALQHGLRSVSTYIAIRWERYRIYDRPKIDRFSAPFTGPSEPRKQWGQLSSQIL